MSVINMKILATCFGALNRYQAKYETQYWYIQRVGTIWDYVLFADNITYHISYHKSYILYHIISYHNISYRIVSHHITS